MNRIFYILFLIAITLGCKQNEKNKIFDYDFGLENKVIIDSNLEINDNGVEYFWNNHKNKSDTIFRRNKDYWLDYSFIDNDSLKLLFSKRNFCLRFNINKDTSYKVDINYNNYDYNNIKNNIYIKRLEILQQRLFINNLYLKESDTLKIKYYYKIRLEFIYSSDTIIMDSILLETIIKKSNTNLKNKYNYNSEFYLLNPEQLNFVDSYLLNKKYFIDSSLFITNILEIRNNRTNVISNYNTNQSNYLNCFILNNNTYCELKYLFSLVDCSHSRSENFQYFLKINDNKLFTLKTDLLEYEKHRGRTMDIELISYNITINKDFFKLGDTIKYKAYFVTKLDNYIKVDSIIGTNIVKKYNKIKHKYILTKFKN